MADVDIDPFGEHDKPDDSTSELPNENIPILMLTVIQTGVPLQQCRYSRGPVSKKETKNYSV